MSTITGPLQGVKVVSCSTAQAGTVPYTLMADLGAEAIFTELGERPLSLGEVPAQCCDARTRPCLDPIGWGS